MLGGILAAPIAAWLVRKLPSYLLGVLVGGFIILTNSHTLLTFLSISNLWLAIIYLVILIGWVVSIIFALRNHKKSVN